MKKLFFICIFCNQNYRSIIKQINTRWITLELAVEQSLVQFEILKSYFLSKNYAKDRFKRLRDLFGDPLTEVYLLFFQEMLKNFCNVMNRLPRAKISFNTSYIGRNVEICQPLTGSTIIPGKNTGFSKFSQSCYTG